VAAIRGTDNKKTSFRQRSTPLSRESGKDNPDSSLGVQAKGISSF